MGYINNSIIEVALSVDKRLLQIKKSIPSKKISKISSPIIDL